MKRLLILVAFAAVLLAGCGDQNACNHPPPEVGAVVIEAQASTDPCAGRPDLHILAWYSRQGTRYPLRCGHRDPSGWGYAHIRYDEDGHGDPMNDPTFSAEMANTLERGVEALASGGTWRYTVKYNQTKSACYRGAWGFRVVLARQPRQPDGYPAGIITALYYAQQPTRYP
jgi:hypothetical protein